MWPKMEEVKMTFGKEMKLAELEAMMQERGLSRREIILEILYEFYENERPLEYLKTIFEPMSDEELTFSYFDL